MKKYVITGGFCVGKTETIKVLEKLGYPVIHEVSKPLIEDYCKGYGLYPWDSKKSNRISFQETVFRKQMEAESQLNGDGVAFLDRGFPDRVVFCGIDGIPVPKELKRAAKAKEYAGVFFMNRLAPHLYKTDKHRPQSFKLSLKAEKLLLKIYRDIIGYQLIKVPVAAPKDRAEFILKQLELI